MPDSSQEQQFGNINLTKSKLVSVNAGGGSIVDSPGAQITRQSYWSLFGDRPVAPGIDWDWAMQILKQQQPDIKKRLKDSLIVLAEVDTVEMETRSQEESPALALEAKKTLTVNGTDAGTIDPQAPMIATYAREDIDGSLLILGTPGAGKTITLLKLAEQLVGEAIAQPQTVIPIIFELSTWRDGQEIEAWLIEQLYENYGGNRKRKIYETWVERRVLLPLLDGLDELGMVRQKACTEKVNEFARTYPQVVVCCRVKEFQQAGVNLSNLRGMVQLKPLSDRQLETYLQQMGKSRLWEQIQAVPEMRRLLEPVIDQENADYDEPGLLRVPLFISLAAQVYERDQPFKGKTELLDRYIDRQLSWDVRVDDRDRKEFKGRKWAYKLIEDEPNRHQTQTYIRWLSQKILDAEITEFQLQWIRYGITHDGISYGERLSEMPKPCKIHWLDTKKQMSMYRFIYRSVILLLLIIVNLIYPKFLFDLILIITFNTISFVAMISMGLLAGLSINSVSQFLSKKSARQNLIGMVKFTLVSPVKRIFKESDSNYLLSILYIALLFSFIVFLSEPAMEYLIKTFSGVIKIFFANLVKDNLFLATSLAGNGIITFPCGLLFQIFNEKTILETASPTIQPDDDEKEIEHKPSVELAIFIFILYNQAIYLFGLIVFAGPPLHIEFPELVFFPSLPILFLMILFGIPGAIFKIDLPIQVEFWQHLPRRLILYINGVVPWNLARFLTYCHDRRLLQQIGGRYRFIHRELLEHFARMEN